MVSHLRKRAWLTLLTLDHNFRPFSKEQTYVEILGISPGKPEAVSLKAPCPSWRLTAWSSGGYCFREADDRPEWLQLVLVHRLIHACRFQPPVTFQHSQTSAAPKTRTKVMGI